MGNQPAEKAMPGSEKGFTIIGEVLGAWGLKGGIRVKPLTDFSDRFESGEKVYVEGNPCTITSSAWQKDSVIITLSGIDSTETAAGLRRKTLSIPDSELRELPEGQYYHFDIIGLEVSTTGGALLGKISDILSCGNDVYVVKGEEKEILIPASRDVIKSIDLKNKKMIIEPIEGLLK